MRSLDAAAAWEARRGGALVVDVRTPAQHGQDGLAGSRCVPLAEIQAGNMPADVARDAELILVCDRGQVSELAALYLERDGFTDVANVRGGLIALRRLGAV